ncbi:surfeit locus protein 1 [Copidosoma floridanum]|uniref:surfeit locus protein 1 n=1 Tax=Copidosoma floridanum TaxID=29053 RepID=UPI0006C94BE3|nr:surfeit locus protein 1 [Copidosoma floridanum]
MNYSVHKTCVQLLRCYGTNKFFDLTKNHWLHPPRNTSAMLTSRTVIARPKEFDELKEKAKKRKEKRDAGFDDSENVGLYGYFLLSIPVITFGLGTWQVGRRQWKLDLLKDLQDRLSKEPIEMPENLDDLKRLEYSPIKVRGEFLYDKEFLVGPRSLIIDGRGATEGKGNLISNSSTSRGYNVITPFKLDDRDLVILVNRGWLPHKYKHPEELKKTHIEGTLEISGINRLNEVRPQFTFKNDPEKGIWHYKDLEQMSNYADTAPIFLDMIESFPDQDMPIGSQTRVNLRNEHLSYIVTWFGLSGLTGYYWYRMFILKRPIF